MNTFRSLVTLVAVAFVVSFPITEVVLFAFCLAVTVAVRVTGVDKLQLVRPPWAEWLDRNWDGCLDFCFLVSAILSVSVALVAVWLLDRKGAK